MNKQQLNCAESNFSSYDSEDDSTGDEPLEEAFQLAPSVDTRNIDNGSFQMELNILGTNAFTQNISDGFETADHGTNNVNQRYN